MGSLFEVVPADTQDEVPRRRVTVTVNGTPMSAVIETRLLLPPAPSGLQAHRNPHGM